MMVSSFISQIHLQSHKLNSVIVRSSRQSFSNICNFAGDVDSDTKLVLCNAVYFKGNWAKKFLVERTTNDADFFIDPENKKKVQMMNQLSSFNTGELPSELDAKWVELPYLV